MHRNTDVMADDLREVHLKEERKKCTSGLIWCTSFSLSKGPAQPSQTPVSCFCFVSMWPLPAQLSVQKIIYKCVVTHPFETDLKLFPHLCVMHGSFKQNI